MHHRLPVTMYRNKIPQLHHCLSCPFGCVVETDHQANGHRPCSLTNHASARPFQSDLMLSIA